MTDYRSILLWLREGRSYAEIASNLGCSRRTISHARTVLDAQGLSAQSVRALSDQELQALFPDNRRRDPGRFVQPDFKAIAERRTRRKRVTRKVEWERYRKLPAQQGLEFYSYPQFCTLFDAYVSENDLSAQVDHIPGEEMQVDWAGDTMTVVDPLTSQEFTVNVFVASLPHSGMIYACGCLDMRMRNWLQSHQQAFSYFGGVTRVVVPDNASTATNRVAKGTRVRDVNEHYFTFSTHFGFGIVAARSYTPKDKPSVEKSVDIAERWIIEYLDDRTFFSIEELNAAIADRVEWINHREQFRGRNQSRWQLFEQYEKDELLPLPDQKWSWATWRRSKVGMNYHIRVDNHFYSVPWKLAGKTVETCILDDAIEVFYDNASVARHRRAPRNFQYSTVDEHVPPSHKDLRSRWDRERIEDWARSIGASTFAVVGQIFNARKVEAQAYNSCLAVLSLTKDFSRIELEEACEVIIQTRQVPSVRKIKDQLTTHRQATPDSDTGATTPATPAARSVRPRPPAPDRSPESNPNVRGAGAFTFKEVQ